MDLSDAGDLIAIGEPCARLAALIGETAARSVIRDELRNSRLQASAEQFHSSGRWRHSGMYTTDCLPEQASRYALPAEFWNTDFAMDGERGFDIDRRGPTITVFADWAAGNFGFQHRAPDGLSMRNAFGVRVTRAASDTLLAKYTGPTHEMPATLTTASECEHRGGQGIMDPEELREWISQCSATNMKGAGMSIGTAFRLRGALRRPNLR